MPYDSKQNYPLDFVCQFFKFSGSLLYFQLYFNTHKLVKTPVCFLFPYLPLMMYQMQQMFDLFHTFTESISNKIERFHSSYTKHFFDLMNMKTFILAPLKLDSFECSCFFVSLQAEIQFWSHSMFTKWHFLIQHSTFTITFPCPKKFLQHRLSLTLFKQGLLQKVTFLQLQKYIQNIIRGQVSGHPSNTAWGR